jgi:hypothetical protein
MYGTTSGKRPGPRLLGLACVVATGMLVLAGSASGIGKYADPTGDNGSAPDITGASVVSDQNGQFVFNIGVSNMPSSGDVQAVLFVDSDANPTTGLVQAGGVDYILVSDRSDNTWGFAHWTGSDWDWDTPWSTARVLAFSTSVVITVNRSQLSNASQINFWALTMTSGGGPGKSDIAPDRGLWNYDLQAGGPDIKSILLATKPSAPKAGKRFTLTVTGLQLPPDGNPVATTPQPESYTCTAKLAGRLLAGSGPGGCTFKLRKKARGKKLVVAVTVQYQGATKTVEFPFKVK